MRVASLDHLVLTVRDLPAAIGFYTQALGMQEVTFAGGRKANIWSRSAKKQKRWRRIHNTRACSKKSVISG